jgi:ribosomal protein S2
MSNFIIGYRLGITILDLRYSLFLLLKSLKFLNFLLKRKHTIFFYLPKVLNDYQSYFEHMYSLASIVPLDLWVCGLLTNAKTVVRTQPDFFIKRFPNAIVLLQNNDYPLISNEAFCVNIVSVGFINTSQDPLLCTYPIPINVTSIEFSIFYYKIILSYFHIYYLYRQLAFYKFLIKKINF